MREDNTCEGGDGQAMLPEENSGPGNTGGGGKSGAGETQGQAVRAVLRGARMLDPILKIIHKLKDFYGRSV